MDALSRMLSVHEPQCAWRVVECGYCGEQVRVSEMSVHETVQCMQWPVPCANSVRGCGVVSPRRSAGQHASICAYAMVPCAYSFAGCGVEALRSEMIAHEQQAMSRHLELLARGFKALSTQMETVTN